jgi:hypothetical protein
MRAPTTRLAHALAVALALSAAAAAGCLKTNGQCDNGICTSPDGGGATAGHGGSPGAAGTTGAAGHAGTTGTAGAAGTTGAAGAAGTTGAAGAAGSGAAGAGGNAGSTGTAGAAGGVSGGGRGGSAGTAGAGGSAGTTGSAGRGGTGGSAGTGVGGAGGTSAPSCTDGIRNQNETDVDCGGSCATKCAVNKSCAVNGDCKTGSCSHLYCALVSGPPNWLAGPSLNFGRGSGAVAYQPIGTRQMLVLAIGGRADASANDVAGTYEYLDITQSPLMWGTPQPSGTNVPSYYDPAVTFFDSATTGRIFMFSSSATVSYTGGGGWQTASPPLMPTPRDATGAAVGPNNRIYVIGGSQGSAFGTPVGIVESYDPTANTWMTGSAPMPTPRAFLATARGTDGLIYAIGGYSASNTILGTVEAYNTTTNQWSSLSEIPDPAEQAAAAGGPDGRIYVMGGNSTAALLSSVNAFTPATNRWTPVVPLDSARYGLGAIVAPDGRIWAVGGSMNPELDGYTTVQIYGPVPSVSPAAGAPGSTASVTGSNFASVANVSVYMGSATGTPLATGTTTAAGVIGTPITFTVPNLAAGAQPLIVVDDRSQYPITLSFRVQ